MAQPSTTLPSTTGRLYPSSQLQLKTSRYTFLVRDSPMAAFQWKEKEHFQPKIASTCHCLFPLCSLATVLELRCREVRCCQSSFKAAHLRITASSTHREPFFWSFSTQVPFFQVHSPWHHFSPERCPEQGLVNVPIKHHPTIGD